MLQKLWFVALLVNLLAACASKQVTDFPGAPSKPVPDWAKVREVRFFIDERPMDGALSEFIFHREKEGLFTVTHHWASSGMAGFVSEERDVLAGSVECHNTAYGSDSIATVIRCKSLADGRELEITVSVGKWELFEIAARFTEPRPEDRQALSRFRRDRLRMQIRK